MRSLGIQRPDPVLSEHEEQRSFVQLFRRKFPGVLIFAIPNGGGRSKAQGAKLKAEGVVPGVPDLFVPEWALFVEMKTAKNGRLSKPQKEIIPQLEKCGYRVIIGYGVDDAIKQLKELYQ